MDLSAWKYKPVANDTHAMPFLDPDVIADHDTAQMSSTALEQLVLDFLRALRDD